MPEQSKPISLAPGDEQRRLTPEETADVLRRIVVAVESAGRSRWMEVASAVVLSLATTASAWCAYQATLWSGVQTFQLDAANDANRRASLATFAAMQVRGLLAGVDLGRFEGEPQFVIDVEEGDDEFCRFLNRRQDILPADESLGFKRLWIARNCGLRIGVERSRGN